jgi:putative MATE family efflux protein
MRRPSRDLTEGSIVRNIWHLALPMMIGNLLQDTFTIVDMIFVGKLGPSALAAVGMSGTIQGMLFTAIFGIYMGTVATVARFTGAKDTEGAENVAMQSLIMGVFCYVVLATLGYIFSPFMLKILGAAPDVIQQGVPYMRISFVGSITMILSVIFGAMLNAAGDAILPMKMMAIATVTNIILDPIMIFGWLGFPKLGAAGSALATVTARGIGIAIFLPMITRGKTVIHLRFSNLKIDFSLMGRVIRIGIFSSIQSVIRNLSALILTRIVAVYGTNAIAAYVIGMRLRMVVLMPGFGLGNAASTLVGQNLGADKPERAEKSAWITVGFAAAVMSFVGLIYIVFARPIVAVFNDHPEVLALGVNQQYLTAWSFGFVGLAIVIGRAFNGAGDTLSPMIMTSLSLIIFQLGISIFLSKEMGVTGVWLGITSANIIQALMMAAWFKTGRWKTKKV